MYSGITDLYPARGKSLPNTIPHSITVVADSNNSIKQVGAQILTKVGTLVEREFGTTLQEVHTSTPKSGLIAKPTSAKKLEQKRNIEREFRNTIQESYRENDLSLVMGNRMSWSTYDTVRKMEVLGKRKESAGIAENSTPKWKKYNIADGSIDTERLLEEANSWTDDQQINWSEVARKYGLQKQNGGQMIKCYLADQNISAAMINN